MDALGCLGQALGAGEVVKADEQGCPGGAQAGAEFGELWFRRLFGRFDFEIDDMAASLGCLEQDVQLRGEGTGEMAAVILAAAGGDRGYVAVRSQKFFELGQSGGGFGKRIQTEFEETCVLESSVSAGEQLCRRAALHGHTQLGQPQSRPRRGGDGQRGDVGWRCVRHSDQLTHLNAPRPRMQLARRRGLRREGYRREAGAGRKSTVESERANSLSSFRPSLSVFLKIRFFGYRITTFWIPRSGGYSSSARVSLPLAISSRLYEFPWLFRVSLPILFEPIGYSLLGRFLFRYNLRIAALALSCRVVA